MVYDITVDNNPHTYWSYGFNTSNCSEIILRPFQMCNLSEVICRENDTEESLLRKIRWATILGTIQAL
jgi:ribonucleoside-diphosphate reductase alpha chain